MVTRPNKVFSADYFTRELETSRYFLADSNLGAYWITGDTRFGVHAGAAVDADHFKRLFEGIDENGNSLLLKDSGIKRRVAAYELSVAASKSVSAVWALASLHERKAIEQAFAKSLVVVADHLGRNAFTRLGANGVNFVAVQPNVAAFVQPDTRPVLQADGVVAVQPQLHAHLVVPNLIAIQPENFNSLRERERAPYSQTKDESIPLRYLTRSLDGHPLFHGAKSWGALQHLSLATELQKLGYSIGNIGKNGTFEIISPSHESAADTRLRAFWSSRRAEIEQVLSESGLTTAEAPALAAKVAVSTRRAKLPTSDDAFARWRQEAERLGIDVAHYAENRRDLEMVLPGFREAEIAGRLADIPEILTEFEATFTHHDLYREIAASLVGTGAEVSRVDQEANRLIETGAIRQIGTTDRERIFSTPEMIRLEREVVEMSTRLAARPWHGIDEHAVRDQCAANDLSAEQTAAVMTVTEPQSIGFIEGRAGTGKTTSLKALCTALNPNFRIIATSISWRTAKMFETELSDPGAGVRVEARALDSWLALARANARFCDSNTLLLVDESSQVGVRSMHALLSEVERTGARVQFIGDRAQTIAVSAGGGIELAARAVEAAEISKVVRQTDPQLRAIVEQLAKGDIASAIEAIAERSCFIEAAGTTETVKTAVDTLFTHRDDAPHQKHLLICKSNAMRLALDSEVRRRLRAEGVLKGDDVTIDASTPSGRKYRLSLAEGDKIRFGVRSAIGEAGVINGTTGTVRTVLAETDGHAFIRAEIDGHEIAFSTRDVVDGSGGVRLSTDYSSTIWSSQGLTSQTTVVVADASFDRRDCYVALSRARQRSVMVADFRAINFAIRADSGFERQSDDITPEERRQHLVRQMSRWRIKSSTLEFLPQPDLQSDTERRIRAEAQNQRRAAKLATEAEMSP